MKKFVQLRGCMGSGKTTVVRQFIERYDFTVEFIEIRGKKYPYTIDKKRNMIATGRYDNRICGGMDGIIKNRELMTEYLIKILKLQPNIIVFEAVLYGVTFKFSSELCEVCKRFGYEYKAYALVPDFDTVLNHIYSRNGGKQILVDRVAKQYDMCIASSLKLKQNGIPLEFVDTGKVAFNEMADIITRGLGL